MKTVQIPIPTTSDFSSFLRNTADAMEQRAQRRAIEKQVDMATRLKRQRHDQYLESLTLEELDAYIEELESKLQ